MTALQKPQTFAPRGQLRDNEPMCRHTSWRVGGKADVFFTPADRTDLLEFLRHLGDAEVALTWIGLGSNVLVRDGGIRGVVVATHKCLSRIEFQEDYQVLVESGVPCAKIARSTARRGWGGAEFFAGIPGTLGGALAMNAGAFGGETWNLVSEVETVSGTGEVHRRTASDFTIGYRRAEQTRREWFLSATLRLQSGDTEQSIRQIKELLSRRAETQPIQMANAGSVFMNPPGDHAARLIEAAGLKGMSVGDARVSERHANFIVHSGQATAADVEQLIELVSAEVERAHGVRLHPEVRIIGDKP